MTDRGSSTKTAGPTPFKTELVRIARAENEALGSLRRGDQQLEDRIACYAGRVGIALIPSVKAHYSAVFISWCMCAAGASAPEFPPVIAHYKYASFSLRNARSGSGLFWARRIENYAPQLGDVVRFKKKKVPSLANLGPALWCPGKDSNLHALASARP